MKANDLIKLFDEIGVVDTHEHIGVEDGICKDGRLTERRKRTLWDIVFGAYIPAIFQCAGETDQPQLRYNDDEETVWAWLKPRLPIICNTGTYRGLLRGLHECYGLPEQEITEENWRPLSEKIQAHYNRLDRMAVYADGATKAHVTRMLRFVDPLYYADYRPDLSDQTAETERRIFGPISYVDFFLFLEDETFHAPEVIDGLDKLIDMPYEFSWAWAERATEAYLDYLVSDGETVALKFACAYMRSLEFPEPDLSFVASNWPPAGEKLNPDWKNKFQSCVMHRICELAGDRGLPVIFHTGLGNADVRAGNPTHLLSLIDRYPKTRFVLLHSAFPYWQELAAIAARKPNVVFDVSWSPLLSRSTFQNLFSQVIEQVQATKVVIGHDVSTIEHMVGTHRITIETITKVLAEKVDTGYYSTTTAETLVRLFARENAERIYSI
jgi:hypothetical protein